MDLAHHLVILLASSLICLSTMASNANGCFSFSSCLVIFNTSVCSMTSSNANERDACTTPVTSFEPEHDVVIDLCDERLASNLSWIFTLSSTYLKVVLARPSIITSGYFIIKMEKFQSPLSWRFNVTNGNQENGSTKIVVSESWPVCGGSKDSFLFPFCFGEISEISEIRVESLNGSLPQLTNSSVISLLLKDSCEAKSSTSFSFPSTILPTTTIPTSSLQLSSLPSSTTTTTTIATALSSTAASPPAFRSTVEDVTEGSSTQSYKASFRITNREYEDDLGKENSTAYNALYFIIYPVLTEAYSNSFGTLFRGLRKLSFSRGSVVVTNWFDVAGNLTDEMKNSSTNYLISGLKNADLDVDPNSFNFEADDKDNKSNKDDLNHDSQVVLIVVVASIFAILVIILIVIIVLLVKLKFGRKLSQCEPEAVREIDAQMSDHEASSRVVMPRSPQLMWQAMPSIKDDFDGHDLYFDEPLGFPEGASSFVTCGGKKSGQFHTKPFTTVSSSSSLSSSCSKHCHENQEVFFCRVSSYHEPNDSNVLSKLRSPNNKRSSTFSSHFPAPSPMFLPEVQLNRTEISSISLDYGQITQDYFAGGATRLDAPIDFSDRRTISIKTPKRFGSWTLKKSSKHREARNTVDFGNVFLPSASPFQLAPINCSEPGAESSVRNEHQSNEKSDAAAINSPGGDVEARRQGLRSEPSGLCEIEDLEDPVGGVYSEEAFSKSDKKVPEISRAPSFTNSLTQLFTPIFTRSPKKPKQIQDNIHRTSTFALPSGMLFDNTNLGTSNL